MSNFSDLNLTTHRHPSSVWERTGWDGTRQELTATRWLVGIGGGALMAEGLRRRTLSGAFLAGIGTSLAWWALTCEGELPDARGWFAGVARRLARERDDAIQQASDESFPASDAPSWTPTVGTGLRHSRTTRRPSAAYGAS